jgi:hypothetical protein
MGSTPVNVRSVIDQARAMARQFVSAGRESVRLPAFDFADWRAIHNRPEDGSSLHEFRVLTKVHFYLTHFLRDMGVEVIPVPVRAAEFIAWAQATGHALSDQHELGHALGDYVNDTLSPITQCRHQGWDIAPGSDTEPALATITIFGETSEQPEVMSAVLHRADGQVLDTIEILAADHPPERAWELVEAFLDRHRPARVFHDQTIRYPSYCADCNGLLVNVASAADIAASGPVPGRP